VTPVAQPDSSVKRRVAILATHPIQYFAPVYRALAARPEIDLSVYFCSTTGIYETVDPEFGVSFAWDLPLLRGYRHKFLPNRGGNLAGLGRLINPSIVTELVRSRFDALIVHGYTHLTEWLAVSAARAVGTRVLIRGESNLLDERPAWKKAVKNLTVRGFLRLLDGALYIGTQNREYYLWYGVPAEKLFFAPYCVDNAYFQRESEILMPQRPDLRHGLGLPAHLPVVLFCGKLVPKKQPVQLLEAFLQVQRHRPAALLYVGDGQLRPELERRLDSERSAGVRLAGFLNQTQIGRAYAASDVLALPSAWGETWGLVVNEAMNFGLPAVVSDRVGCAGDLVEHGTTGYVTPAGDVGKLAQRLDTLLGDEAARRAMGGHAQARVAGWGVDACVDGFVKAIQAVTARPR
jgi:glycosyltransferase involved in cell wall biosynthesis